MTKHKEIEQPEKHAGGRPPFYTNAEDLRIKIEGYLANCPDTKKVVTKSGEVVEIPILTITGLVLHLGFCDRQSFYAYEKKKEFSYTIKKARSFIEKEYEMQLHQGNCTGAIFALKNFGWFDTVDHKHTGDLIIAYGHRKRRDNGD